MGQGLDTLADDLRLRFCSSDRSQLTHPRAAPVFTRPFTVISAIERGDVEISFKEKVRKPISLEQGNVCILPVNVRRHARSLTDTCAQSVTAGYVFEIRGGMDLMHFVDLAPLITGQTAKRILNLLVELYTKECTTAHSTTVQKSVFRQRVGYTLLENILSVSTLSEGALSMRRILPVVEFLSDHYAEHIDIPDLIKQTGFSRTHFFRIFKKWTGFTPVEFIKQRRIREASLLLIETDLPIAEIGFNVGYNDQFFFSKVFKSVTGLSPSSYRAHEVGI